MKTAMFIVKLVVRIVGTFGLVVMMFFALDNPAVENRWLLVLLGVVIALNIALNDPA